MSGSDRNAPCSCGSGRKYKRCCGALQPVAAPSALFMPAERESALGKLMAFCARAEFAEDFRAATKMYDEASGDRAWDAELEPEPEHIDVELPLWFATAWPVEPQATPIDLLLTRRGWTLSTGEREFLRRLAAAGLRVYEIVRVDPGKGFEAVDLWSSQRVQVRERLGSSQLVAWDLLACRLMDTGDGLVIEGAPLLIPRMDKEPLVRAMKHAIEQFVADGTDRSPEAFFRRTAPLLVRPFLDQSVKSRGLPEIRTGDGEPVVFAKAVFSVKDAAALRRALKECPAIDADEDGRRFTLLREEKDGARMLGTFVVDESRMQFEALSERRAKEGRALIESIAGAAVTYRATELQSVASAMASRDRSAPPAETGEGAIPREEQGRLLTTFYESHYRKWLDEPVPALEGRTPRQAARSRSARLREAVTELVKGIEQQAERERRERGTSFDPAWMWSELGLPRL